MKKLLPIVLACVLVCGMLLALCACQPSQVTPPDPDGGEPDMPGTSAATFVVVRGESSPASVLSSVIKIRKALSSVTGGTASGTTDAENKDNNDDIFEILVGETNRQASIDAMNGLAENEYLIRKTGNKIVIVGGSDKILSVAVDQFLFHYVGYVSDTQYTANKDLAFSDSMELRNTVNTTDHISIMQMNDSVDYVDKLYTSLSGVYANISLENAQSDMAQVFDSDFNRLVILAGADKAPVHMKKPLNNYLADGGRVLLLGGPAFEEYYYMLNDQPVDGNEYWGAASKNFTNVNSQLIFDTTDENCVEDFRVSSGNPSREVYTYFGDFGLPNSDTQMFYEVINKINWECYIIPFESKLTEANAIGFWAKSGDENTDHMHVEMMDGFGARWISDVTISDEWEYYLLTPSDFTYYNDGGAKQTDTPWLHTMKSFTFGFANTTIKQLSGYHSFYLSEPRLINLEGEYQSIYDNEETALSIDLISPLYELYPITNAANIVTEEDQIFLSEREYVIPEGLVSCYHGRRGTGFDRGRADRFIPLLRVTDEKGLHSGYAAWITLYSGTSSLNGSIEGSMVGCFSATTNDFYNAAGIAAVTEATQAMMSPAYLVEGGTDEYTYITVDEPTIRAGASYIDFMGGTNLEVSVSLYSGDTLLAEFNNGNTSERGLKHNIDSISKNFASTDIQPDRAVTTLKIDGVLVDRITQNITFWEAKPESERNYVYTEDGYFKINGEIITFFGANYVPTFALGEPDYNCFEFYTAKYTYEPMAVYYDLQRIKELGFNAVSIGLHGHAQKVDSNNMLDLIRMCEEAGIYVDLAIRGTNTYDDEFIYMPQNTLNDLILLQHFQDNDNIIAYDICWERYIGTYDGGGALGRKRWNADWREWIVSQYGSIEHAEKLWGCKAPKDSTGQIIGLDDDYLNNTSKAYRAMTAAYYRFMDDMTAKEFTELVNYMKTLDPNHLISFRMNMSGSGMTTNTWKPQRVCYDFNGLSTSMDFMAPEAYALNASDPESMLQVLFTNAYARYAAPDAPVVWKEFGTSVWTGSNFDANDNIMKLTQAEALRTQYEYFYKSYTSATYVWWYDGGYRVNERSDYGIINPDGSERPSTAVIREYADKFINQGERPAPDVIIEIDRDDGKRGIYDMFDAIVGRMEKAWNNGQTIAIVNKMQGGEEFGKFYADETLDYATGGTDAEGMYPLRYVNGQIKSASTFTENGKTYMKVVVCNNMQSTWRAGTVSLVSTADSTVKVDVTIDQEVDHLEEVELVFEVTEKGSCRLRFEVGGIEFGMLFKITVK